MRKIKSEKAHDFCKFNHTCVEVPAYEVLGGGAA